MIAVKPVVIAENVEDARKIVIWIAVKKIAEAAGVETVDNATNHLLHQVGSITLLLSSMLAFWCHT